ncbi:CbtB-domain containing protein (plasmid) [Rhizobium sp. NIBRBAC000502774]|uniref:CbtB domain-containing protein n=1 Tax=Agrobacterium rosae TaxID=1972867 RepID=A0AAW9FNH1_9HYPH|nr:CbtB domain-containing protein [Agrobacterium rosae]MDX8304465.1 CbtB domain-containing protein [Agrobacterium rosae]QDG94648.1 CbtB-domain containing protein [Rhizobium sp. NIBRBAC000502774]
MSSSAQHTITSLGTTDTTSRLLQSAAALFLGVMMVGFVGFSHVEAVHNAAHDTRHANAFPCH